MLGGKGLYIHDQFKFHALESGIRFSLNFQFVLVALGTNNLLFPPHNSHKPKTGLKFQIVVAYIPRNRIKCVNSPQKLATPKILWWKNVSNVQPIFCLVKPSQCPSPTPIIHPKVDSSHGFQASKQARFESPRPKDAKFFIMIGIQQFVRPYKII